MGLFSRKKKDEEPKKSTKKAVSDAPVAEIPQDTNEVRSIKVPETDDVMSYQIVREPHVTEKASMLNSQGVYVFKINPDANTHQVKYAIEKMYKVKVKKVRVITVPSKTRTLGRHTGTKPGYKKAMVTLKKGESIDLSV